MEIGGAIIGIVLLTGIIAVVAIFVISNIRDDEYDD